MREWQLRCRVEGPGNNFLFCYLLPVGFPSEDAQGLTRKISLELVSVRGTFKMKAEETDRLLGFTSRKSGRRRKVGGEGEGEVKARAPLPCKFSC